MGGDLCSLIGTDDLRPPTLSYSISHIIHTALCLQTIRDAPCYILSGIDINNGHTIHKPLSHGDIGDVDIPHLVKLFNIEIS